jgi:hypothetical protein
MKTLKTIAAVLLLAGIASPQTCEETIKAEISLAQAVGFNYGMVVDKKIFAVAQKKLLTCLLHVMNLTDPMKTLDVMHFL